MKKRFGRWLSVLAVCALITVCSGLCALAEDAAEMVLKNDEVYSGDTIRVEITLPEGRGELDKDWMGLYAADVDESNVYDGAGLGIWCYIGSNDKYPEAPDADKVTVTFDEDVCTNAADGEIHWPLEPGDYKFLLFYDDGFAVAASLPFTVKDPADKPTEAPTDTPAPTDAPTEAPTDAPTDEPIPTEDSKPTDAPEEKGDPTAPAEEGKTQKSGCGSSLGSLWAPAAILTAALVTKKTKNEKKR